MEQSQRSIVQTSTARKTLPTLMVNNALSAKLPHILTLKTTSVKNVPQECISICNRTFAPILNLTQLSQNNRTIVVAVCHMILQLIAAPLMPLTSMENIALSANCQNILISKQ